VAEDLPVQDLIQDQETAEEALILALAQDQAETAVQEEEILETLAQTLDQETTAAVEVVTPIQDQETELQKEVLLL